MDTKMIIFDKDGTLLNFEETWRQVWQGIETQFIEDYKLSSEQILANRKALGVTEDGFTFDSIFVAETRNVIAQTTAECLGYDYEEINEYYKNTLKQCVTTKPIDIILQGDKTVSQLQLFKKSGLKLALVTADDQAFTDMFVDQFNLRDVFDEIFHNQSNIPGKPHHDIIKFFTKKYNITNNQMIMVGDSYLDYQFFTNNQLQHLFLITNRELYLQVGGENNPQITLINSIDDMIIDTIY